MRSLLDAIKLPDLIKCVNTGGETTVEAEDLALNDGGQGQVVEQLGELLPNVSVAVLTQALIVETVPVDDYKKEELLDLISNYIVQSHRCSQ